jgi:hypothetical protein
MKLVTTQRWMMAALLALAASGAGANPWPNGVPTAPPPGDGGFHGHRGFARGGLIVIEEPPVIVEREVVREVPVAAPAPPAPPPPPRKPYVLGRTYASLPGPCMKLVEHGAAFFGCGGKWYRAIGAEGPYLAVARP